MALIKLKGIVIKEAPYKDSDKLLTILTKEKGVLRVYAKHAKRPSRKMLVSGAVLSFSEFEISGNENKGYYINSANLIEGFDKLKTDIILLTYSSHILEIIHDCIVDDSLAYDAYTLLLYTLCRLTRESEKANLTVHVFELKMLFLSGYMPVLDKCVSCKKTIGPDTDRVFRFDCRAGGMICENGSCASDNKTVHTLSPASYKCLMHISKTPSEKLYCFHIDEKHTQEIALLASSYLCENFDKDYKKLEMLKEFIL